MTATFNPDLGTARDRIRQTIGDTDVARAQVQDETIAAYMTAKGDNETAVAIQLCYDLAAKWAGVVDSDLDDQAIKASHISANYKRLAESLTSRSAASLGGTSTTPGISVYGVGDCRGPDLSFADDCTYVP